MATMIIHVEKPQARSGLTEAMQKRHGTGPKVMKDRRAPRGGSKNDQRAYREERY